VIDSGRARLSLLVLAMLCSEVARAGVWGADPSIGVSGAYGSDPALLDLARTSETDAALLIDSPITYQGDALKLSLIPGFRVSDTRSYTSLNSDFAHLSASGELDAERDKLTVTAGATRDSSLYQNYLVNGQAGVRRDGLSGELGWTRHLTERLDAGVDVSALHVRYGAPTGNASLVSYKYGTVSPDLSWQRSEKDRVMLSASAGQYDSLDGTTRSRSVSGQLGYDRSLSEIWSFNLSAGYTRQQNRLDLEIPEITFVPGLGFVLVEVPVRIESQTKTPVYAARLTRSGPRLTLYLGASRQEVPTGFAFLSRQTTIDLQLGYAISSRWSTSLHEYRLSAHDPSLQGPYLDRSVNWVILDSAYQLSEHCNLDIALSRVDETYNATDHHVVNNQVTLTLNYKFNHIDLQ
jgi:hypothetical protein